MTTSDPRNTFKTFELKQQTERGVESILPPPNRKPVNDEEENTQNYCPYAGRMNPAQFRIIRQCNAETQRTSCTPGCFANPAIWTRCPQKLRADEHTC